MTGIRGVKKGGREGLKGAKPELSWDKKRREGKSLGSLIQRFMGFLRLFTFPVPPDEVYPGKIIQKISGVRHALKGQVRLDINIKYLISLVKAL